MSSPATLEARRLPRHIGRIAGRGQSALVDDGSGLEEGELSSMGDGF
jgi:hypothetical protein